ncbi:hypothetical protein [uncultured Gammaproteobacteria bacterium]|nr:hypothetical protein [uncultured Gammaproteobacteria bacterium]
MLILLFFALFYLNNLRLLIIVYQQFKRNKYAQKSLLYKSN